MATPTHSGGHRRYGEKIELSLLTDPVDAHLVLGMVARGRRPT